MNYKVLTTKDNSEWNGFLAELPDYAFDVYYTPEYYELYENYGDGKALCFVFQYNGQIALYPFLLNSINKIGYELESEYYDIQGAYGYNGITSSVYDNNFCEKFYAVFQKFCIENNIIAEFTRFHPLLKNYHFSENYLNVVFDRKTVFVKLENELYDEIFKNYQRATQKQIVKAKEVYGIEVKTFRGNFNDVAIFYDIYTETMSYVSAEPYLFFNRAYFQTLLSNPNHVVFVCYYQNETVALAIVLGSKKYLHGHLIGVKNEFRYMSLFSVIYDAIIRFGIENNYKCFHIGGGATAKQDDTLLKFKMHFSNTLSDFYIGKKIHNVDVYDSIINQWMKKNNTEIDKFSNVLLKYRY